MAVDFTKPVTTDLRATVLQGIRDYMDGQAKLFDGISLSSTPTNAIRYNGSLTRFEKWNGSAWVALTISEINNGLTIKAAAALGLSIQNSSGTPFAIELYRTDTANSSKVYNSGSCWAFQHRPTFAGNVPYDTGNLTIANYLTTASAAATYPTKTGSGASGSWGINITGSAPWASVTGKPSTLAGYGIVDSMTAAAIAAAYAAKATTLAGYGIGDAMTAAAIAATYQTIAGMSSYAPKASPALTGTATYGGNEIGFRDLPTASVTTGAFAAADQGKCVYATGGVTVPNSTMAARDVVTILNTTGSAITITASISTLRQAGTTNTGSRTLAGYGIATIVFVSSTLAFISGAGLS